MRMNREREAYLLDDNSLGLPLLVLLYRALMVLLLAGDLCLFGAMPVKLDTVELPAVLLAYAVLLVFLQGVYRACDVGHARVSELVASQSMADLLSMGVLYLGVALYAHQLFNPVRTVLVLVLQILVGCGWTLLANHLYFRNRKPPCTAVIYRKEDELKKLLSTPYFRMKYDVCRLIRDPENDIQAISREIEGCDVVFITGVDAALANGMAKLCLDMDIRGYFVPHIGHIILAGAQYMSTFSVPILKVQRTRQYSVYRLLKRLFDFVAALAGSIVTLPIMLLTALVIWLEDRGPVFYRQVRLTKNGREFKILKFRSMSVNAEKDGVARLARENDSRITKVGRFIRACRIDELPQLFNILAGDMSLVGPRPERPEIAAQYQQELPEFALRMQVKAGLTGLAQVYGRYNTEPYNKLQMDLMYINEMSFLKDLQLILITLKILFIKESAQGITDEAVMSDTKNDMTA